MKKVNVLVAVGLIGLMLITVACSSESADKKDSDGVQTINAIGYTWSEPPSNKGEGLKMLNEKYDIDYHMQFVPESEYNEKLSAVMASGDVPDMVAFRSQGPTKLNYYKWARQGAFMPLDDYIDDLDFAEYPPDYVWDAMKVDGKTYGIPTYYPEYTLTPMIRKDWLDHLGLDVPTNFEELKEVALAFTNDDPNDNGKDDTYGLVLGEGINPNYNFGPYWSGAWYHKNDEGQYIPGTISEGRKEVIGVLHELYQEGAVTQDFALLSHDDTNTEFYSGKGGIYYGGQYGMSDADWEGFIEINPDAEVVPIPPFEAPDGTNGYLSEIGYLGSVAFSVEDQDNPEKVEKMLKLLELGKTFTPWDERNPENEDYDWYHGHEGKAYEMDGDDMVTLEPSDKPKSFLVDSRGWPPTPEAAEDWKSYKTPQLVDLVKGLSEMHKGIDHYADPTFGLISETDMEKGSDLTQFINNTQTKMIGGEVPISDWDKMVEEYLEKGGKEVIDEYNEHMKENDKEGTWE